MPVIKNETLRNILKYLIPFVLIPASVALGFVIFNDKRFAFVTLAVVILAFILFIAGFESKKTGSRRLVLAAVFVALSVAGRFIPFFKPVTAITILAAIYLGGETGFLVGSLSAVLSNFYFGQGPWTPFQMFAWGMIGLIAGLLHRPLVKSRILLIVYGLLSGILFSFIMDIWTVLWYNGTFDISYYLSAITAAIPYTILYSVSNVLFLLLFAKPFGEKLSRVKIKYGV
jgi:energy-coupling factor transport system substrate-specific component